MTLLDSYILTPWQIMLGIVAVVFMAYVFGPWCTSTLKEAWYYASSPYALLAVAAYTVVVVVCTGYFLLWTFLIVSGVYGWWESIVVIVTTASLAWFVRSTARRLAKTRALRSYDIEGDSYGSLREGDD